MSDQKKDCFEQICVWQGVPLGPEQGVDPALSLKLLEHFGFRVQHKASVQTLPGARGSGGRSDVLFGIHCDDIGKFAVARFSLLRSTSSRTYGIMFKQDSLPTSAEQADFFHTHGVPSFAVDVEFDSVYVFSFRLFNVECDDTVQQEQQAEDAIEKFLAAYKQFEQTFACTKPSITLCSGSIRWWEDVLQQEGHCVYPQHILKRFKARW